MRVCPTESSLWSIVQGICGTVGGDKHTSEQPIIWPSLRQREKDIKLDRKPCFCLGIKYYFPGVNSSMRLRLSFQGILVRFRVFTRNRLFFSLKIIESLESGITEIQYHKIASLVAACDAMS